MQNFSKAFQTGQIDLFQELTWHTGFIITEVSFRTHSEGWLLCIKADSFRRGALICFLYAHSMPECLELLGQYLRDKQGLPWKVDKYPRKVDRIKPTY